MREARGIDLKKAQHKEGRQSKRQALEKNIAKDFVRCCCSAWKARHAARPSYIMGSSTPWNNCTTSHVLGMYFHYSDIAMEMFAILSS